METSNVNWSLRVALDAPNVHLEQKSSSATGTRLVQTHLLLLFSFDTGALRRLLTVTAGSAFRCSEPTCSSSSW